MDAYPLTILFMTNSFTAINGTATEKEARMMRNCPKCNSAKEEGMLVCWDCFKRGENPLKYFVGSFEEWIKQ